MQKLDWQEFVNEYYQPIYRFCFQFMGSAAEAEDATQDAFLKAYRSQDSLKEVVAAKAWIYSIARNTCLDRKRWWKRQIKLLKSQEPETEIAPGAVAGETALAELLTRLIAALPTKQREVFVLRHWHGFSTKEVSELLKIEEGTVKSHLKRAVDKLKQDLGNSGYFEDDQ